MKENDFESAVLEVLPYLRGAMAIAREGAAEVEPDGMAQTSRLNDIESLLEECLMVLNREIQGKAA